MPNKAYSKGYTIERKARKEIEKEGFYTIKSGGSLGLVDIVAFDCNVMRLIQVKSTKSKSSKFFRDKNTDALIELQIPFGCRKEIWIWSSVHKKWDKRRV